MLDKIKVIIGQVMEETEGVKEYQRCSAKWKGVNNQVSDMYYTMAKQELEHANHLKEIISSMADSSDISDGEREVVNFAVSVAEDAIFSAKTCLGSM